MLDGTRFLLAALMQMSRSVKTPTTIPSLLTIGRIPQFAHPHYPGRGGQVVVDSANPNVFGHHIFYFHKVHLSVFSRYAGEPLCSAKFANHCAVLGMSRMAGESSRGYAVNTRQRAEFSAQNLNRFSQVPISRSAACGLIKRREKGKT